MHWTSSAGASILEGMKRIATITLLTLAALTLRPRTASADATAFVGFSPTLTSRSATGFSVGVSLLIVGFEFEYSHINESPTKNVPGMGSGMFNVSVQTPTRTQLYLTAGGGVYRESLNADTHTNVGLNVGGGVKIPLAGPVRVRIDYRVFNLNGSTTGKSVQRFYGGVNIAF
jgi:opacity protein-like surface antigen